MTRSFAVLIVIAVTLAIMAALAWMFKEFGALFAAGVAAGVVFREVAFRLSEGYWFTG